MKKITLKKIKRHNRRFFTVYCTLLVIAALAVAFGYGHIRTLLTEYESSQPKYVAEDAARPFLNLDYSFLYDYEKPENQALATREEYAGFAGNDLSGKDITYHEVVTGGSDDVKTYGVYADGKRFCTFTIRQSGQTTDHGFARWAYDSASINLLDNAFEGYTIKCYDVNRVFVDGVEIPADQMTLGDELPGYDGHLYKDMTIPRACEYTISERLTPPRVTTLDAAGREVSVECDEYGLFTIDVPWRDEEMKPSKEKWILETAKTMSEYTIGHASLDTITKRVAVNSPAYKSIVAFDKSIIFIHKGWDFKDMRTEHYYSFADDYFAVDVHYHFIVDYYEGTRDIDTHQRFFFRRIDDKWLLYDSTML